MNERLVPRLLVCHRHVVRQQVNECSVRVAVELVASLSQDIVSSYKSVELAQPHGRKAHRDPSLLDASNELLL